MTAMDTLAAIGAGAPGIPRFDDGMVNIRELIRLMAEALVNEITDAQADDACADGNRRNGYRERLCLAIEISTLGDADVFPSQNLCCESQGSPVLHGARPSQ